MNADISYNTGGGTSNSLITNHYYKPDGTPAANTNIVRNDGNDDNDQVTVQVDFTDPKANIPSLRPAFVPTSTTIAASTTPSLLPMAPETKLSLSNNYKYREMVNAAYATYSSKLGAISYQLGLRAEYSKFDGELIDSAKKFGYTYPEKIDNIFDALFPASLSPKH